MIANPNANEAPREPAAGYQPLVIALAVVCAGIVLDRFHPLAFCAWWSAAAVGWIAWLLLWRRRRDRAATAALLVCLAATGGAWHHARWNLFGVDDLVLWPAKTPAPPASRPSRFSAPRRLPAPEFDPLRAIPTGDRSRLYVRIRGVRDADDWLDASGRATVLIDGHLLGIRAGDRLRIFAQLSARAVR